MKIVIASGKGGTGKSMFASSLAIHFSKSKKIVACDCDVDAPNLGLWLGATDYDSKEKISTSEKASIKNEICIECGKCLEICRFGAIMENQKFFVNPLLCEGCGVCQLVCPVEAIEIKPVMNGEIMVKETEWNFLLISGQLYPGESGSGKIVEEVRKKAEESIYDVMILDSAAGIGCPVVASITACDFAILVTEPTPSGFADLERILEVVTHFQIPFGIVINKWDINLGMSTKIEEWSKKHLLGKISYDREVVNSIVNLKPVILSDSTASNEIRRILERIETFIEKKS